MRCGLLSCQWPVRGGEEGVRRAMAAFKKTLPYAIRATAWHASRDLVPG